MGGSEIDTGPTPIEELTPYYVKVMGIECGDTNLGNLYCNNEFEDCQGDFCFCCKKFSVTTCDHSENQ